MKLNKFTVFGYLAVGLFIYLIVSRLTSNPMIFVNKEALIVIVGGLFLSAIASFPASTLHGSFKALKKVMSTPPKPPVEPAREIVHLSTVAQRNLQNLEEELENIEHPFLQEGVGMVLDGIGKDKIIEIMEKRATERWDSLSQDVNVMLTLGKYCPALGLAATVLGLVELLSKLEKADMAVMGFGMAVALSATFYGIVIANLVFTPLSELLMSSGEGDRKTREMIIDGIVALQERQHPLIVGETVNSYLPFDQRIDFGSEIAASGSGATSNPTKPRMSA